MSERIAVRGTMGVVLVTLDLRRKFGKGRQFYTHLDATRAKTRFLNQKGIRNTRHHSRRLLREAGWFQLWKSRPINGNEVSIYEMRRKFEVRSPRLVGDMPSAR
jgi:hypothetical protein